MNIGVLGGTFDPIHVGHLVVAEEARARLDLAEILFVPAGEPPLKTEYPISAVEHRVQMVRLAITDKPHFRLCTLEIERVGPSYTVDTIAELQARLGGKDKLFFILGLDNLAQLPQWHQPSRLIQMCQFVAVYRPGYPQPDLSSLEAAIPGLSQSVVILDTPVVDISASEVRDRITQGLSIRDLVPEPVEKYIREHGLYTA